MFEHHGDSSWCSRPGLTDDCYTRRVKHGFGKLLSGALDLDCELNDVRKLGSGLTWCLQFAFRWTSAKDVKPLSLINLVGKLFFTLGKQESYEGTFLVHSARGRQVSLYSGKWPAKMNGDVVQVRTHNHLTIVEKGFLFHGRLNDLKLTLPELHGAALKGEVLSINSLGYTTFQALEQSLMQCSPGRLLCTVEPTYFSVENVLFDRMPNVRCRPWRLTESEAFTSISFLDMHSSERDFPGTHVPHSRMHTHWIVEYVQHPQACSCYSFMYSFPGLNTFLTQTNCSCLPEKVGRVSIPSVATQMIYLPIALITVLSFFV